MNLRSDRPSTKNVNSKAQLLVINTQTLDIKAFVGKELIDYVQLNRASIGTEANGEGTQELLETFRKESTIESRNLMQALQVKEMTDRILTIKEENSRKEYLSWIKALNPHIVIE